MNVCIVFGAAMLLVASIMEMALSKSKFGAVSSLLAVLLSSVLFGTVLALLPR